MLLALLYGVWIFLVNTTIEGIIYIVIDYFVKSAIKNASTEEEKGVIWLGECILLLAVSLLVYLTSHVPWLVLTMVILTLAFTQIRGQRQVNLVYWWYQLLSRWDEFKLHEQSMEEFNRRRSSPPPTQVPPPGPPPLRNIPLSTDPPDYPRPFHVSPRRPLRNDFVPHESLYQRYQPQPLVNHQKRTEPPRILVKQPVSLTSKIKSVLGMGSVIPAGLKNPGNLCFMNSILQCLARSPGLTEGLEKALEREGCSVAESELVSETKALLKQLNQPTDYRLFNSVDSVKFRLAASVLQPAMIAAPRDGEESGAVQRQQDAAELLMWLLDALHDCMNRAGAVDPDAAIKLDEIVNISDLTSWPRLKEELEPATVKKISELRDRYMREIDVSCGVDKASEALQNLSDVEWMLHRLKHRSVWDQWFSGQLLECQHCLACSRLSVEIQTFTVLPVPIVDPRQVSGFVYLEDCFSKFMNTENLFGKEGLCCPCSNSSKRIVKKTPVRSRILSSDSAVNSPGPSAYMSPIPTVESWSLNDSGFPDNYRTSTPIADGPILTNGQRRALLRQLPKCLVIQLMRFRFNQKFQNQYKVHTPVHIPLRGLSLGSMIFDGETGSEDKFVFDLYGMCLHLGAGATNVGHYVAYCQDGNGSWWKLDDEETSEVNMDFELNSRIVRENAYVLFYKRRDS